MVSVDILLLLLLLLTDWFESSDPGEEVGAIAAKRTIYVLLVQEPRYGERGVYEAGVIVRWLIDYSI